MFQSVIWKNLATQPALLSVIGMVIVASATFGIAFIPVPETGSLENKFMPGHYDLFHMYDSSLQRLGHKIGLFSIAIITLLTISAAKAHKNPQSIHYGSELKFSRIMNMLTTILLITGSIITILSFTKNNIKLTAFLLLFSVLVTLSLLLLCKHISRNGMFISAWILIIVYSIYLIVPGFLMPIHIRVQEFGGVQFHYSIVLSLADRLAINPDLIINKFPHYGIILPSILAVYQKHFGLLNFSQHIFLVQISQGIFLLTALLALYLWRYKRALVLLLALTLFGTFCSTAHSSVYYPNQSGWRFIGFPLWVVLILLLKNKIQIHKTIALGSASGIFLLLNTETGIIITIGSFIYICTGEFHFNLRKLMTLALCFAFCSALTILAFLFFFHLEFDHWPFSIYSFLNHNLFNQFIAGYGGLPLKINLLAIFIFMHCTYVVISNILKWHAREITLNMRIKLSIASVILIWFAYYMNRPDSWNLWTYIFLYSFILVDYLDFRRFSVLWKRCGFLSLFDLRVASVILLFIPYTIYLNYSFIGHEITYINEIKAGNFSKISGVNVQKHIATLLYNKAEYISTIHDKKDTIYLTRDSMIIPLITRQLNPFDVQDIYLENFNATDLEKIVDTIRILKPKYIFVDEIYSILTDTDFAAHHRLRFYYYIIGKLNNNYRYISTQSDWRVFERNKY